MSPRNSRLLVWITSTMFGAFVIWFAMTRPTLRAAEPATSGIEKRVATTDILTMLYVDQEARLMIRSADLVLASTDKGMVQITPGVVLRERLAELRAKPGLANADRNLELRKEFAAAMMDKSHLEALAGELPGVRELHRAVAVFGGNGHDIIQLGPDGEYARGGGGSDHFVLEAGNVLPGKTQRFHGDDGWDTAVLANGFSLKDVVKRTSPYQVRDPVTGGMYELDVEALGVVDNVPAEDLTAFRAVTSPSAAEFGAAVRSTFSTDSSKHYSSSTTQLDAVGIFPTEPRLEGIKNVRSFLSNVPQTQARRNSGTAEEPVLALSLEAVARIPLTHATPKTASPFGGYPVIFAIENGFFAVSSERPVDQSVLRNSAHSATISVSSSSLADSQVRVRLLTEEELTLRGDLADPVAVEEILSRFQQYQSITSHVYRPDRTIAITLPDGAVVVMKPTLFVTRTGWTFPGPVIQHLAARGARVAFAIVGIDGFAQSFVEISRSSAKPENSSKDFVATAIDKNAVRTLASAVGVSDGEARELVPHLDSRIVAYEPRSENQYPFAAYIDGGVMFLMAEAPLEKSSLEAAIENASVSISSLFYARRNALLMMSNGDRIFSQAALMDPKRTILSLDDLQQKGAFASYRLTKELLGPLAVTFASGRTAKMMPILFASRAGRRPETTRVVEIPDGRGRFAFAMVGVDGYSQVAVDIGGSTILPATPKP